MPENSRCDAPRFGHKKPACASKGTGFAEVLRSKIGTGFPDYRGGKPPIIVGYW
jgi:hypothetical protein